MLLRKIAALSLGVLCIAGFTVHAQTSINVACDTAALVAAVNTANGTPAHDTLNLAAGCVYMFSTASDVYAGFGNSALPRITSPITIEGNGAILQRQSASPNFRLIFISDTGTLTVNNVTISGGVNSGDGGGMYNSGTLTVTDSTVSGNNVPSFGGGIYNSSSGTLTVSNSVFSGNSAGSYGGAIRSDGLMTVTGTIFTGNTAVGTTTGGGAISNNGTAIVGGSTFSGNSSQQNGGAITHAIGTMTIIDSVFSDNHAALSGGGSGGGIASSIGTVTVIDSIITGNSAIAGGGISSVGSTLTVSGSTISGNIAVNRGGGITTSSGTLAVTSSIITGNRTTAETSTANGGGIYNNTSTATIINSLITGNATSSLSSGGGIYNQTGLTVINSTIAANNAASGREIYNSVTITVTNSIVWGSSSPISGQPATVTYSNVQGGYTGTGNLNLDPLFISPQPYTLAPSTGGNYHLQSASPVINMGSNPALPADIHDLDGDDNSAEPLPVDLAGNPRIVNATVDMGAYEHQTVADVVVSETAISVTEGGTTDTYTVRLSSRPSANVIIDLSTGTQATASPDSLTFTSETWDDPQTVTVAAVDDEMADGTQSDTVTHSVGSPDAPYNGIAVASVAVTVADDDTAGVVVGQTDNAATEGGDTASYTVVLTSQPSAIVTVTPTGDDDCTVGAAVTFTDADWDTPKSITVTAVDDAIAEGDHSCTVTNAASGGGYDGVAVPSTTSIVTDDDPFPVELLDNTGFESGLNGWIRKNTSGDKLMCKPGKAHAGDCAFKFKGGAGEKTQLLQIVDLTGVALGAGDVLTLSGYFQGSQASVKAKLILTVIYDGSPSPVNKTKVTVKQTAGYMQVAAPDIVLTGETVSVIRAEIKHQSTAGKLLVDDVSLIHTVLGGRRGDDTLPVPVAPDSFRGQH